MYALAQLPKEQLAQQLSNGLILLALGMSIVFLFLTILVFTTKGVSRVVKSIEKRKPELKIAVPVAESAIPAGNDAEIAVAIAAAMAKSKS